MLWNPGFWNVTSNHEMKPSSLTFIYLPFPFIYVILIVCYVSGLKKIQKTEQPADTIDSQNRKCHTSLGIFFAQREIPAKTPLNPHNNWVYDLFPKITKKQKKIPFGIFSGRLVSFLRQDHIGIFQQKTSNAKIGVTNSFYKCDSTYRQVIPKISALDNPKTQIFPLTFHFIYDILKIYYTMIMRI